MQKNEDSSRILRELQKTCHCWQCMGFTCRILALSREGGCSVFYQVQQSGGKQKAETKTVFVKAMRVEIFGQNQKGRHNTMKTKCLACTARVSADICSKCQRRINAGNLYISENGQVYSVARCSDPNNGNYFISISWGGLVRKENESKCFEFRREARAEMDKIKRFDRIQIVSERGRN